MDWKPVQWANSEQNAPAACGGLTFISLSLFLILVISQNEETSITEPEDRG